VQYQTKGFKDLGKTNPNFPNMAKESRKSIP